ncbi:MAG: FAD-binding protein [Deltaproteobacteria bacterium]|nr:FAD-binding protein [Deltaproteobacteria bacterium]MBW2073116.1 FAD-binding protein [Deltaproteobacteria bacterium]
MQTITIDVLVVGAGAAGIRAALAASEAGAEVVMVAKGELTRSGSTFSTVSQGWGIQALVGEERADENLKAFYDDIMRVGLGRCDPKLVRILVEESGTRMEDLISYGIRFRKDSQGNYIRAKGCFSDCERAFLTEDIRTVRESFLSMIRQWSVKIITGDVVDLIIADGACWGAWAVSHSRDILKINAKATILATGGGAGIFRDHLVSDGQIGDGYALAYRAGAELNNLEFVQFMLGLKKKGTRLFLPLTYLRKPGMLCDSEGRDLLEIHIPDLRSRARAVDDRQKHFPFSCRDSSYLVDIAVAGERQLGKKVSWRKEDEKQDFMEVVHFGHAFNGGVKINEMAESTIPGLFAAGEVAAGSHGADRIGGCMMTATQVFGARAGKFAALRAGKVGALPEKARLSESIKNGVSHKGFALKNEDLLCIKEETREISSQYLMPLRHESGLRLCLSKAQTAGSYVEEIKDVDLRDLIDVRNRLIVMGLISKAALKQKESLGSHYRSDFPPVANRGR